MTLVKPVYVSWFFRAWVLLSALEVFLFSLALIINAAFLNGCFAFGMAWGFFGISAFVDWANRTARRKEHNP